MIDSVNLGRLYLRTLELEGAIEEHATTLDRDGQKRENDEKILEHVVKKFGLLEFALRRFAICEYKCSFFDGLPAGVDDAVLASDLVLKRERDCRERSTLFECPIVS